MKNELSTQHHASFESIRQTDQDGNEFWLAREACRTSGQPGADHFADLRKMVGIGSGTQREVADVRLSRYACYAKPSKNWVAPCRKTCRHQTAASSNWNRHKRN